MELKSNYFEIISVISVVMTKEKNLCWIQKKINMKTHHYLKKNYQIIDNSNGRAEQRNSKNNQKSKYTRAIASPYLSAITLNIRLKFLLRRHRLEECTENMHPGGSLQI